MSNEIHLYTAGADPFVLRTDGVMFYIHQGTPNSLAPPPVPPLGGSGGTEIYTPIVLQPPYQNYITAPQNSQRIAEMLNEMDAGDHDLGLILSDAESDSFSGEQLRALLDGVSQYDGPAVSIHLVSTDPLNNPNG